MTRDEAIKRVKGYLTDCLPTECYGEVEEIIEALKQKPMFIAKSDGSIEQIKNCDDCLVTAEPGKYHVSVMKRGGVYSDKVFDNAADAKCELCYARGDDYSDSVLGLSIWKEFK